jgi:hypothetical protein
MGLEEKRAVKAAQEGWFPKRQKELNDLAGCEVPYEVDWESFADDMKGLNWFENNGPNQVGLAFRQVCKDQMGKDAVKEGVKKVLFKNIKDAKAKKLSFQNGVLELQCAFAQSPGGRFDPHEIKAALDKGL